MEKKEMEMRLSDYVNKLREQIGSNDPVPSYYVLHVYRKEGVEFVRVQITYPDYPP